MKNKTNNLQYKKKRKRKTSRKIHHQLPIV